MNGHDAEIGGHVEPKYAPDIGGMHSWRPAAHCQNMLESLGYAFQSAIRLFLCVEGALD